MTAVLEVLAAEVERLRAVIAEAIDDLDGHGPNDAALVGHTRAGAGCVLCYPAEAGWPCLAHEVAMDLREALADGR